MKILSLHICQMFNIAHSAHFTILKQISMYNDLSGIHAIVNFEMRFFLFRIEKSSLKQLKYFNSLAPSIYLSVDTIDICAYTEHNWLDMLHLA